MIDRSTEYGQRIERRLAEEPVGWLTTVSPSGQPQPIPIWFLWQDDDTILMYSQSDTPKLRNINNNPRVSFNLNSNDWGGDVIRFQGTAEIGGVPPATDTPAFIKKFEERMASMDMTPEAFAAEYSVPVLMKPSKLWGF